MRPARILVTALGLVAATLVVACGGGASGGGATRTIDVRLSNAGCPPSKGQITAGRLTVHVTNQNGDRVTEVELVRDGIIVGEKENLTPGLSGSFSVNVAAGTYELYCPGATTERTRLTVTGAAATPSVEPEMKSALDRASAGYGAYVRGEVDQLVTTTGAFVAAVKAGDIAQAKQLYGPARVPYESVEPVAESFGDLDPAIDARANDVDDPSRWTGFHRIEKALWQDGSLAGMAPIADRLLDDVHKLRELVRTADFKPETIANGAVELLDEVSQSKITGEEERYSKLDLLDMAANVDGSEKAFAAVRPALALTDGSLAATIDGRFAAFDTLLARYRTAEGYRTYDGVTDDDRKAFSQAVNGVAEPLSKVAGELVRVSGT